MVYQNSIFHRPNNDINDSDLIKLDLECPIQEQSFVIISNASNEQQSNIDQLSAQISSSKDVETLLDHVNWRMFIYLCEQTCSNFSYSEYEFQGDCSNDSSCCLSNSIDDLLLFSSECGNSSCTTLVNFYAARTWFIFVLLGLLCLLGNIVVIYDKIICLRKAQNQDKEIQIYYILVLNLALADLLMGIYLTAIGFESNRKVANDVYSSEPNGLCNGLGIISTLSSQVSLTILFIISIYRLLSVIRPYKSPHLKIVITVIIIAWTVWLIVATLPTIPLEPFKSTFSIGLIKDRKLDQESFIDFAYTVFIIESRFLPIYNNFTEAKSVLLAVTQFPTPSVMQKFATALGWVNLDTENWSFVGYYDIQYSCSIDFLANEDFRPAHYLSLTFVFYNLIVSLLILISYILVSIKVYKNESLNIVPCKGCMLWRYCCEKVLSNAAFFHEANSLRTAENQEMFKRISFIVLTDLLCWIPLCIASLVIWRFPAKIHREELLEIAIPFQITTSIVVPFNSILNPYIYSCNFWRRLFKTLKNNLKH